MDERKNNMLKQNKKREKAKKIHESEIGNISKYIQEVSIVYSEPGRKINKKFNNDCSCLSKDLLIFSKTSTLE